MDHHRRKGEGVTPGFTIRDSAGEIYWIKFDPAGFPEMASGAEVISTKFFHAFGYHVAENYLATLRPGRPADRARRHDEGRGRPQPAVHARGSRRDPRARRARSPTARYRVLASRNIAGRPLGPFRYYGTRPDDPNDIFPHEHRRELRGLEVFSAWLNHDEVRSSNSHDSVVAAGGRQIVRHHLLDFGSTLGSGSVKAQSRRAGNEFVWESRPTLITMLTLGLYVRPWIKVDYPDMPAVGRLRVHLLPRRELEARLPEPGIPQRAARGSLLGGPHRRGVPGRGGGGAWCGRRKFTDPEATEYLTKTLLERRAKVLEHVAERDQSDRQRRAERVRRADVRECGRARRRRQGGRALHRAVVALRQRRPATHQPIGDEQTVTAPRAAAPGGAAGGDRRNTSRSRLRAFHPDQPAWASRCGRYFRRAGDGWSLVGLERNP